MADLRKRLVEEVIASRLRSHGAVLIRGPKAVGKTTTARGFAASEVRLDQDRASLVAAQTDPRIILDGPMPRLIDEFQLATGVFDAVRGRIDDAGGTGMFLLTGSSTPDPETTLHTGARRIAPVTMRTMSFLERGMSTGTASLGALLAGEPIASGSSGIPVTDAVEALAIGGWPTNLALTQQDALDSNIDYLDLLAEVDIRRVDGVDRDPDAVRRLLASYARNVATDASLRTIGRRMDQPLSEPTLHDYRKALGRLFLIEDQDAWQPSLRSRIRLHATPKRHLADPSLAVAALEATKQRLLGSEIELTGFLFESQVVHDLRVYATQHRADVRFYRDNKGLEVDAIVETRDGRWIGVEIKLGASRIEEGVANLLALREKLADDVNTRCGALIVVVADSPTYTRPDGVIIASIASLGP